PADGRGRVEDQLLPVVPSLRGAFPVPALANAKLDGVHDYLPLSPVAANLLPSPRSGARRDLRRRRRRPVGNRELDRERGTPAKVRLDEDPPVHGMHELSTDVEAETAAAHAPPMVRLEPVELFHDPFLLVERAPEPPV